MINLTNFSENRIFGPHGPDVALAQGILGIFDVNSAKIRKLL